MVKVVGVRFKAAGKVYYFDPLEFEPKNDDGVIVETARGVEYGIVFGEVKYVNEDAVVAPLKPIIRIATEEDTKRYQENLSKKPAALSMCQTKIDKRGLDMKLVDVEWTFDNSKIIFYFTADGRVDFRDLVKDLAAIFRTRIELRQIGVRDETKMMGGIGCCGRDLCCHSWLENFTPVSIKMAKTQSLSLNPIKISGICGRLMCCLQYENEVYTQQKKGMPEPGEKILTPDGPAIVNDVNVLECKIRARLIVDEDAEDAQGKLSSDYYTYSKEDIKRIEKRKKPDPQNDKGHAKKQNARSMDDADLTNMTEEELARLAEE